MCTSNPTRYCSSKAKTVLDNAKKEYLDSKDSEIKRLAFRKLVIAQKEYDETASGQQVLIQNIKNATGENKIRLMERQKLAVQRRREKNNQFVITNGKTCPKCKIFKQHTDFSPHKNKSDGFQNHCRSCRAITSKIYHDKTPELTMNRRKTILERRRISNEICLPILKTGCVDCSEYHENAMDFDHLPEKEPKLFNVQRIYTQKFQNNEIMIKVIKKEISKCAVRCCNCHRKITIQRQPNNIRKRYLKNPDKFSGKKEIVYQTLANSSCVDCNTSDFEVLEFDHVRGSKKIENSKMLQTNLWTEEDVKEEISKCDIRCVNCHRKKTAERLVIDSNASNEQLPKYKPTKNEITCHCGNKKKYGSTLCKSCNMKPRAEWPSLEDLVAMLGTESFESVSRKLGVSGNAIRNRLRTNGIDPKSLK